MHHRYLSIEVNDIAPALLNSDIISNRVPSAKSSRMGSIIMNKVSAVSSNFVSVTTGAVDQLDQIQSTPSVKELLKVLKDWWKILNPTPDPITMSQFQHFLVEMQLCSDME